MLLNDVQCYCTPVQIIASCWPCCYFLYKWINYSIFNYLPVPLPEELPHCSEKSFWDRWFWKELPTSWVWLRIPCLQSRPRWWPREAWRPPRCSRCCWTIPWLQDTIATASSDVLIVRRKGVTKGAIVHGFIISCLLKYLLLQNLPLLLK